MMPDRARRLRAKVSVIQSGRNGGYSFGNNVGIRWLIEHHRPDIIGIANPDVIFDGAFVGKIKQVFAEHPDYAVLTGIQLKPSGEIGDNPFWEDESTPSSMFAHVLKGIFLRTSDLRNASYLEGIRHSPRELNPVWAVEGSLFFVRREDFEAAGLFDENVFLYYEEHILAFKLSRMGRKTGVINTISFVHAHPAPKDCTPAERFRHGMEALSIRNASLGYYFGHYVTSSKVLLGMFRVLLSVRRLKSRLTYLARRLLNYISFLRIRI